MAIVVQKGSISSVSIRSFNPGTEIKEQEQEGDDNGKMCHWRTHHIMELPLGEKSLDFQNIFQTTGEYEYNSRFNALDSR